MTISFAVFTFLNLWWVNLIPVMAFSTNYGGERSDEQYAASPTTVNWKKALRLATALAIGETILLALVIKYAPFSLRD